MKTASSLNDTELHFQDVLDALSSNIAILDGKGTIIAVNQAWRSFGIENGLTYPNSGIGSNYLDVCDIAVGLDADTAVKVATAIRQILKGKLQEAVFEYPCHSPADQRWFQVRISKFMLGKDYIILIHDNITARKKAEENLRDSEQKFSSAIEQSSEGMTIIDSAGRIIEWNKQQEIITGLKKENVIGEYIWDVQASLMSKNKNPNLLTIMKEKITSLLMTGSADWARKPMELEMTRPDGSRIVVQSVVFPMKHNNSFMACSVNRDISELKKAKEAQLFSENKYRNYVKHSPVIEMIIGREGNILEVNPEACTRLGYSADEFRTMNMKDVFSTAGTDNSSILLNRLLEEGFASAEILIRKKDNSELILSTSAVALPEGKFMILCVDVTELKKTHMELQKSESFLNNILDNIPLLITVKEAEKLTYIRINRPAEQLMGYTNQQIIGKGPHDVFLPAETESIIQQEMQAINEKKSTDTIRTNLTFTDRMKHIMREKKIPVFSENGDPNYLLTIVEDITDQVNLETEFKAQLARLEAISQLSTGLQTIQIQDEIYPTVLDLLLQITHAPMGSIWLFDSDKNELYPVYHSGGGNDNEILVDGPTKVGMGIPGMVYLSQKPYVSRNYESDPYFSEQKRGLINDQLGGVTLPLRTSNSYIGVINLSVYSDREFTDEDIKLLTTLSEIAGNAIQNITLKEQTEQRLTRISAISSIDRAISSSLDLQVSLEILVSNLIAQLNVDAADVLLFNPHSQLLEYSTGQGFYTNTAEKTTLRLGESYAGKAALSRELVRVNIKKEPDNPRFNAFFENEKFLTYFGIPLIAKGQLKGVLETFNRSLFEPDDDWINFFTSLAEQASIAIDNTQMFEDLQRSNTELVLAYNATIEGWSRALDLRDKETEGHTLRVTDLTERLAHIFDFPDIEIKYIRWGALLHDIGKLGVPDGILLKPGPLTDEEWEVMRKHPIYAYDMLSPIGYLRQAVDIPYCHHEKWDGTGYPRGLKEEQIPLAARIFALVDIWDALRSDRPYRKAWPEEKIIEHIRSLSGTHLDPRVVDLCLKTGLFGNLE